MSFKNLYYYLLLFLLWCVIGLCLLVLLRWVLAYASK